MGIDWKLSDWALEFHISSSLTERLRSFGSLILMYSTYLDWLSNCGTATNLTAGLQDLSFTEWCRFDRRRNAGSVPSRLLFQLEELRWTRQWKADTHTFRRKTHGRGTLWRKTLRRGFLSELEHSQWVRFGLLYQLHMEWVKSRLEYRPFESNLA